MPWVSSFLAVLIMTSTAWALTLEEQIARIKQSIPLSEKHILWMATNIIGMGQLEIGTDETINRFLDSSHLGIPTIPVLAMNKEDIRNFLIARPVPVILGPNGHIVAVDRHHLMLGMHLLQTHSNLKIKPEVYVHIVADWRHLTWKGYESRLVKYDLINPIKTGEKTPVPLALFPKHISELENNPLRSFVWAVRRTHLLEKVNVPHWEWKWVEFLYARGGIFKKIRHKKFLSKRALWKGLRQFQEIPPDEYPDRPVNRCSHLSVDSSDPLRLLSPYVY